MEPRAVIKRVDRNVTGLRTRQSVVRNRARGRTTGIRQTIQRSIVRNEAGVSIGISLGNKCSSRSMEGTARAG